jgi:hypothetical protein
MFSNKDSLKGLVCGLRQSQLVLKPDLIDFMDDFLLNHSLVKKHGSFENIPLIRQNVKLLRDDFVTSLSKRIDIFPKKIAFDLNSSVIDVPYIKHESSFSEIIFSNPEHFRHGHITAWKMASHNFSASIQLLGKDDVAGFFRFCFLNDMAHPTSIVQTIHGYYVMKSIDDSFENSEIFHVYLKMNTKFHIHEYIQLHNFFLRYGSSHGFPGPINDKLISDWIFRGNGFLYPADFKTIIGKNIDDIILKISLKKYPVIIDSCVGITHSDFKKYCIEKNVHKYLIDNTPVSEEEVRSFNPSFYVNLDTMISNRSNISLLHKNALNYINNISQINNTKLYSVSVSDDSSILPFEGSEQVNTAHPSEAVDFIF